MANKNRFGGQWIQLYRNRIQLLPVLGRYNISQTEESDPFVAQSGGGSDIQPRDTFTRNVCSSAVCLQDVADIDFLRRKGHCLATETEVLHSQRFGRVPRAAVSTHLHADLKLPMLPTKDGNSTVTTNDYVRWSPRKMHIYDHRRRASVLHKQEHEKRKAAQRHLENKIMKSREYYYNNLAKDNSCVAKADGVVRKYVSEALDTHHKQMLSRLEISADEMMDKGQRHSMIHEWKQSAMSIMDLQAEEDLKMVADYKKMIKSQSVVKQKRAFGSIAHLKLPCGQDIRERNLSTISWDMGSVKSQASEGPHERMEVKQSKEIKASGSVRSRSGKTSGMTIVNKLTKPPDVTRMPKSEE